MTILNSLKSPSKDVLILKHGKSLNDWKAQNTPEFCPLCGRAMKGFVSKNKCCDHDHDTGVLRTVICRNCNGIEGKVLNLAKRATYSSNLTPLAWLQNLVKYWIKFKLHPTGAYYPGTTIVNGKIIAPKKAKRRRGKNTRKTF